MPGKSSKNHRDWKKLTAYKMRQEGSSLGDIAKFLNVEKSKVRSMIELGERLSQLEE